MFYDFIHHRSFKCSFKEKKIKKSANSWFKIGVLKLGRERFKRGREQIAVN